MLGRNGNIAYVRYNSQGRIVPGGPILSRQRPRVGNWQPLSLVTGNSVTSNSLRAFVRIDAYGRVVPSSLLLLSGAPSDADSGTSWLEINATYRPQFVPTTTTTSTSSTTTSTSTSTTSTSTTLTPTTSTTTTTADPFYYYLTNKYNCPDCSTIVESNFLIKGSGAVPIGEWVIRNPGTGFIAFQVLSAASPNPSAYLVDTGYSSLICPCPTTTTTTTEAPITTTTTQAPLDFTLVEDCYANISFPGNRSIVASQFTGGSGTVYVGNTIHATEIDALNGSFAPYPKTYIDSYTYHGDVQQGGNPIGTWWIAIQDVANPANKIAKSVDVIACPNATTTTTSSTSTSTSTTTTSPYKTFMFNPGISADLPTVCALSGTSSGPWYFIGPGTYPTVGDTIYWSPGFTYALNGAWMKIANGHAINGDANGYITQDTVC